MTTTHYNHQVSFQIYHKLTALLWSGLMIFLGYGLIKASVEQIALYGPDSVGLLFLLIAGIFTLVPTLAFLIIWLTSFPSIKTSKQGIQVNTLINSSDWLPWENVQKLRHFNLGIDIWFIGIRGLGRLYTINGLIYWLGVGGFLMGKTIKNRQDFLSQLKTKRPDLFGEYP